MRLFLYILFSIVVIQASGQALTNLRMSKINPVADTLKLDTLSIVHGSVMITSIDGNKIADSLYTIDYAKSLLILSQKLKTANIGLYISYRVFPYNFSQKFFHKDFSKLSISEQDPTAAYSLTYNESMTGNFFEKNELNKQGSISRGITFGNNQDVIVNSNLNLQLSGKLSDEVQVLAAISDNNIPIQPDGNSQQIQEFDKVFISIFDDKTKLTVGDFEITRPTGYFLNVNKKAQGAFLTTRFGQTTNNKPQATNDKHLNKERSFKTSLSGAVSKGKYNRMVFTGQEGNQGPYKLKGAENETYIIILAGTEKVFVDGKLVKRGQENEYVMDYNAGEIAFTPNLPITKDKRIAIEFEYSEKNYARFMVFNSNEFITKKSKWYLNVFSEQDSKNQPLQQDLTDDQKRLLASIGDSLNMAVVPNIDSVPFNNDQVLYKKADSLVAGIRYYNIYVYSSSPDSARYRLGFSKVGDGNGNYVQVKSAANGKVYKWVAPVNSISQGNFEPVVLLVTPKKNQMIAGGGLTKITPTTLAGIDLAVSNNDLNTFSSADAGNDVGYGVKVRLLQYIPVGDTANVKFSTGASYELTDKFFRPVERYRAVEFDRDWNLTAQDLNQQEHLLNFNINFFRKLLGDAKYDFDMMDRGSGYSGIKNELTTKLSKKGFTLNLSGSLLNSSDAVNTTDFLRHRALLSKRFSFITLGIKEEQENNLWKKSASDSLLRNSFSYTQWEGFISNSDTTKNYLFANYKNRKDYLPYRNSLSYSTLGQDIQAGMQLMKNPNHNFKSTFTYRTLTVIDTFIANNEEENSVTGRIEHNLKLIKGVLSTSTFYEIGSGLEIKKEFSYLEVAPGQGVYKWTDYNNNGVKELDEFEIANFQDEAGYIRVFTPTSETTKTYFNRFNQLFNIQPGKVWSNKKGFRKFAGRFSDQFAFRVEQKNTNENFLQNINPLAYELNTYKADSTLVSYATSLRNTFSFNKSDPKFGLDYLMQKSSNKVLLVNGFDFHSNRMNGLRLRWNITRNISLLDDFDTGNKKFSSEFFSGKNYNIAYNVNEVTVSLQPNLSFRGSLSYKYSDKKNTLNNEILEGHDIGTELRYNILSKGNFSLKINYIKLSYNSGTNTPVAYEMLEGLMPGNNVTWTVLFQRSLSGTLQLSLSYNGRKSEETKTVHTGGIQLRAYF